MAQKKDSGTRSARIQGEVGKPNMSVAAIKAQYKLDEERRKRNYANAQDAAIKYLRDISKSIKNRTIDTTDREKIRRYLTGNIGGNGINLIKASRYLYYRSHIYHKLVHFYSDMYCLECRNVTPPFNLTESLDSQKALQQFNDTLDFLDIMNMKNNFNEVLLNLWIEDCSFNLFFHDETGSLFYRIEPDEAIFDSKYMNGPGLGFAMDMSKWRSEDRQKLIEQLGSPLKEMYNEYQRTNIKYIHVPDEYSAAFKIRMDLWDSNIPPIIALFSQLANLNDLVDIQADADELSIFKLVYYPLKILSNGKTDDFEVTPDLALEYFDRLVEEALPANVSAAPIPGDELKVIDFSNDTTKDIDRVEQSQSQILGSAGGAGAILDAQRAMNNTALINAALKNETAYALSSILPQIESFTNRMLSINVSEPCHVSYFPVSIYTKEDYRKTLLEANQYSFSMRLSYATLLGFTERQTLAALHFEQDVLGLHDIMKYPLQSSYTMTGEEEKGEVGQGRDPIPDDQLSPSGDRDRNR